MCFPNPPHITVALDPGSTTGIAVFSDVELIHTFTTKAPHEELRDHLNHLHPDSVICERGPSLRQQPEACAPVERLVIELFGEIVHWVRPTQWKGNPKASLPNGTVPITKHERDAARMGAYWLASNE